MTIAIINASKVLGADERKTVDIFEKIRDKAHVISHTAGAGKVA